MFAGSTLNLFFALIASALTLYMGVLVFVHDRHGVTNQIFIIHSLVGAVWAIVNYFSISHGPDQALPWIRLVIFFAVPHVFLFFLFVRNFPNVTWVERKRFLVPVFAIMAILMAATQTRVVFRGVQVIEGNVVPIPGPGIPIFAFGLIVFFVWTIVLTLRKYRASNENIKAQWRSIGIGLIIAYALLIFLVFIRVIAGNDTTFVPYSPLFILPVFAGAAVAILKHRLFNVKVISAELLTFALLLVGFVQMLFTKDIISLTVSLLVIVFILISGILLIRSVLKEVKQREELATLSEKLKIANQKLKALDQARAEFITMASHQLRTPPATLKWYLAAIEEGDFGNVPPELKEVIAKLEITNNGMISLIEDMLNVSRIERGTIEFHFEETDLLEVVTQAYEQLKPMAIEKKLGLVFNKPKSNIPKITADREKIKQVVNNFIDNAIKYSKTGTVRVNLEMRGNKIRCTVTDNGIGMSEEAQKAIFHKFGRGKDSSKYAAGLGLGLYVAKIVVEQHKGKIWAESPGPGKGSSFIFELPLGVKLGKTTTLDLKK